MPTSRNVNYKKSVTYLLPLHTNSVRAHFIIFFFLLSNQSTFHTRSYFLVWAQCTPIPVYPRNMFFKGILTIWSNFFTNPFRLITMIYFSNCHAIMPSVKASTIFLRQMLNQLPFSFLLQSSSLLEQLPVKQRLDYLVHARLERCCLINYVEQPLVQPGSSLSAALIPGLQYQ